MKNLRYTRLFPLLHLIFATLLIYHQQKKIWPDLKNRPPVVESEVVQPIQMDPSWNPCYEYRPSVADRFLLGVEFPTRFLFGFNGSFGGCQPGLLSPLFRKLRLGVKTGTIFLDLLLAFGIALQWWLVGRWVDVQRERLKPARLWLVPAIVITLAGSVMLPAGFGARDIFGFLADLAALVGFLSWVFMLLISIVFGIKTVLRYRAGSYVT